MISLHLPSWVVGKDAVEALDNLTETIGLPQATSHHGSLAQSNLGRSQHGSLGQSNISRGQHGGQGIGPNQHGSLWHSNRSYSHQASRGIHMHIGPTIEKRLSVLHHMAGHDQYTTFTTRTYRRPRFGSLFRTVQFFVVGVFSLIIFVAFVTAGALNDFLIFALGPVIIAGVVMTCFFSLSALSFYKYKQGGNQVLPVSDGPSSNIPMSHGVTLHHATGQHGQVGLDNVFFFFFFFL